ncbi:hypothetical protein C663_3328 [Bacillus subtilis XF-1]|nr:hypothetical protein C663_3328 [Bacillus subtilis XF-1]ASK25465.1 hypothetical protein BSSX_3600 [Bacillus subtilis]
MPLGLKSSNSFWEHAAVISIFEYSPGRYRFNVCNDQYNNVLTSKKR